MITAIDTNVLLDLFLADPTHGARSARAVRQALVEGRLTACEVVWAEVCTAFASAGEAEGALGRLGVRYDPLGRPAAARAGDLWRVYREAGGGRARIVADFLVGAHALEYADRLLTRDRGFFRGYFSGLEVVEPT